MSRLDSHVAAVQRKLTLAVFIDWLGVCALGLGIAAIITIVLQKAIHFSIPSLLLWSGVVATLAVAALLTVLSRPSRDVAAVAIDEKLGLKEKFSTALSVRSMADPFAQAVVRDAEQTANSVQLAGRFPLTFPIRGYWAIGAIALACLAMFLPQMDLLGRQAKIKAKQDEEHKIAESKQVIQNAIVKIEQIPKMAIDPDAVRIAHQSLAEMLKHAPPDPQAAARRVMEELGNIDKSMKAAAEENKKFAQAKALANMLKSNNAPIQGDGQ